MMDAFLSAARVFLDPSRLLMMGIGMVVGIVVGILPGLGAIFATAILVPFAYKMDMVSAMAMIMGALGVVNTADATTSILIGVPGSGASVPTTIEGYPMARRGEAARALSAAYVASLVGGVLGAVILTLLLPVARPVALAFGTPELFMACALGVSMSASLVGKDVLKGIIAGLLGLLIGTIGPTPAAAVWRYTFNQVYLMEGISIVILAIGLFGLPEVVSILAEGGAVAKERVGLGRGWLQGARDVLSNFWLVIRGALIGVWVGILPGLGGVAGSLLAYAQAAATSKDKEQFGKGEIRGIISPEAANNSVMAGQVLPTLFFSVPGSVSMAILMSVLLSYGFLPGPRFAAEHLDLVYVIIWTLILSSIVGAAICFAAAPALAKLTYVPFANVVPALLLAMIVGAYQTTRQMADLTALLVLGLLGWTMKRAGWPRGPLLIGFVLAAPLERYFWLTVKLFPNLAWVPRPGVIVLGMAIVGPLVWDIAKRVRTLLARKEIAAEQASAATGWRPGWTAIVSAGILAVFGYAVLEARTYPADARLLPWAVAIPGLVLGLMVMVQELHGRAGVVQSEDNDLPSDPAEVRRRLVRELCFFAVITAYYAVMTAVGFRIATIVFVTVFLLRIVRLSLVKTLVYLGATFLLLEGLGGFLLGMKWPIGWFGF